MHADVQTHVFHSQKRVWRTFKKIYKHEFARLAMRRQCSAIITQSHLSVKFLVKLTGDPLVVGRSFHAFLGSLPTQFRGLGAYIPGSDRMKAPVARVVAPELALKTAHYRLTIAGDIRLLTYERILIFQRLLTIVLIGKNIHSIMGEYILV